MEDITENKPENDAQENQPEEEGEDEDKSVLTVDAKMGAEEAQVREKIEGLAKKYLDDEELDIDSPETMAPIEKTLADEIQKLLLAEFGKNWSVVVGKRFAMGVGLRENDKFANFKIGFFNVLIFQCNQKA
jgi:Dynein light chain type 1